MPFITTDLLRRRAEHNEGCLSDLEEIALHQQDLERITVIGDVCRKLQILYLCNNYIPRIENLVHLKHLKYLNLAVNNIKLIEGLEGCEMLEKLDLTLNFIAEVESVRRLRANPHLKILHLTGNPCTDVKGYRHYVLEQLPQLVDLDGEHVVRSQVIEARHETHETAQTARSETVKAREAQRIQDEMRARGIDPFPPKFNEAGERVYGHSAEERLQMLQEQREDEARRKREEEERKRDNPHSIAAMAAEMNKKPEMLTPEQEVEKYGRVLLRNEAKLPFTCDEGKLDSGEDGVIVTVEPGKYVSTTLIQIDMQPTYTRITVKGKVLQIVFPVEISPDKAKVQRSQTTGQLRFQLPVAANIAAERLARKKRYGLAEDDVD